MVRALSTKEWLTPEEVACHLGRDVQQVYRWLRQRLLPAKNVAPNARKPRYRVHSQTLADVRRHLATGLPVGPGDIRPPKCLDGGSQGVTRGAG